MHTPLPYRSEVDGLRAVAVLPVILFHAGAPGFAGGYIGVDVFFVISGYLITSIILRDHAADRFSFKTFYERRARRLLPALYLVIAATLPFAFLWMTPYEFKIYGQSIGYTALFVANIGLESETGYFHDRADLYPFLHTWSLSVEEQFYIIFPLLLLWLMRWRSWVAPLVLSLIFVGSLALSEIRSETLTRPNFYYLTTRAWELLAGCGVALWLQKTSLKEALALPVAGVGAALLAASYVIFDGTQPHPSLMTLLPVGGTALLLLGCNGTDLVSRALSWRPLVFVGLISYPAYLWHQPLFAFARIRSGDQIALGGALALSLAALGLAFLTWKYLETPVRRGVVLPLRKNVFRFFGAATASIVAVALVLDQTEGVPQRFGPEVARIAPMANNLPPYEARCQSRPNHIIAPENACLHGDTSAPRVAIWGDSHAMVMAGPLGTALADRGLGLVDFTFRSCTPVTTDIGATTEDACLDYNRLILDHILASPEIDLVVLHGRWPALVAGGVFDNGAGGIAGGGRSATPRDSVGEERLGTVRSAISDVVSSLLQGGKEVVVLSGIPEAGWDVPGKMVRDHILGMRNGPLVYPRAAWDAYNSNGLGILQSIAATSGILLVDPSDTVCGPGPECQVERDGLPQYFDDDHLTQAAAARVAEGAVEAISAAGLLPDP